jgi:ribosomal protein S18 acetylase RimI-like enzyme
MAKQDDIPSWLCLATEVSPIFGVDDMAKTDSFKNFLQNSVVTMESLVAIDNITGDLMGAIGFSKENNHISWLAVSKHQKQGVGSGLLSETINHLDKNRDIEVITFCNEDPNGEPARILYEKFGFIEKENNLLLDGHKRSKYVLIAKK